MLYREEYRLAAERQHHEFERGARQRIQAVQMALAQSLDEAQDLAALYAASENVTRAEFRRFATHVRSVECSLQALEWVPRVTRAERAAFEQRAEAEMPDFHITEPTEAGARRPAGARAEYFPVYYLEPYCGNEAERGLDLGSLPQLRAYLYQARDSGRTITTGRVDLGELEPNRARYGFRVFVPVYRPGTTPATLTERRRDLQGFVVGLFRLAPLVEAALADLDRQDIALWFYDEARGSEERFLYWHAPDRQAVLPEAAPVPPETGPRLTGTLELPGRLWSVLAAPAADAFRPSVSAMPWAVLAGGWLLTAMLVLYLLAERRRRVQLARTNQSLRDEIDARHQAEAARRREHAVLSALVDSTTDAIFMKNPAGRYVLINAAAAQVLGHPVEAVLGRTDAELLPAAVARRFREEDQQLLAQGEARIFEAEINAKGEQRTLSALKAPCRDGDGHVLGVLGIARDITEHKQISDQLRLWSQVFERSSEAIYIADAQHAFLTVNRAFTLMTGYDETEAIGQPVALLHAGQEAFHEELQDFLDETGHWQGEITVQRKDRRRFPAWLAISAVPDVQGAITHYIGIFSDISEMKVAEAHIRYLAHYDFLTNLPNRVLLEDRLQQALAHARRRQCGVAMLFLDLDHFKTINDTLGHPVGDRLLKAVATRLQACVRASDTVSRQGGDEFVILLAEIQSPAEIIQTVERLLEAVAKPYPIGEQELDITASLGISLYPEDGEDLATLIQQADIALHRAKEAGRNTYRFFTPAMSAQIREQQQMKNRLRRALERDELRLYYQPQVDLRTGAVIGVEALLRWQNPTLGLVSPAQFIPLAEETGLIVPIGQWVLETACTQLKAWQNQGLPPLRVAVNISGRQFVADLPRQIAHVIEDTALANDRLELEITESLLMVDADQAIAILQSLKDLGVQLAIDDFGTGYSSLNRLKRFPLDRLKIDRTFVQEVTIQPDDAAIARAVIALAHNLRLKVIAEGVENEAQRSFLQAEGCDEAQGYLFGRPLPAEALTEWLHAASQTREATPSISE